MYKWVFLFVVLCLSACGSRETLAPVVDPSWRQFSLNAKSYTVRRGDTLYSIAFRYDADYKYLARINNIHSPYTLSIGQVIKLHATSPVRTAKIRHHKRVKSKTWQKSNKWLWPVRGQIKSYFAPKRGLKGINIAGKKGEKIHASKSGVVAYSGRGLENYGNLIIIKHPDNYLTAYGNNSRNLVREGQYIHSGQVIAEMGVVNRKFYGLHFEIRKKGKPVNPLAYLGR